MLLWRIWKWRRISLIQLTIASVCCWTTECYMITWTARQIMLPSCCWICENIRNDTSISQFSEKKILPNKKYFCHSVYSCIREYDIEARLNPFIVSIIERISIKGIRIRLWLFVANCLSILLFWSKASLICWFRMIFLKCLKVKPIKYFGKNKRKRTFFFDFIF